MNKWIIPLLWLSLIACNQSKPALQKLPSEATILCFGDSLTYGTGAEDGQDYPSILAQLTNREVINAGKPGEISSQGRQRLPTLLDEYRPNLLILIHGGNDILRKLPLEQTRENLKAMIAEAKQRNIDVVLLGVPEFGLMFLHSAPIYADIAEAEAIPSDLETLPDVLSTNRLKSDPIHPNSQGYQQVAKNIVGLLQANGAL
ncbi:MAG: GDSL-type esterase/lipase family protein [Gammaproteobacteria bacterium]